MDERILLIGANGQVGSEFINAAKHIPNIISASRNSKSAYIELSDPDSIRSVIKKISPDVIVNAAAYTAVDRAEEEPELAMSINGNAPGVIAEEAKAIGAKLIHYSTDYVFGGNKFSPYTEEDIPRPINVYGETKLEGDKAVTASGCEHIILRTSWVYSPFGNNFMKTMLRLANERDELNVVNDQIGCPTSANYIAATTISVLEKTMVKSKDHCFNDYCGVYNLTTSIATSWFEFAKEIVSIGAQKNQCKKIVVKPISTSEYPTKAKRPMYSVLANDKLHNSFGVYAKSWKDDLTKCLNSIDIESLY